MLLQMATLKTQFSAAYHFTQHWLFGLKFSMSSASQADFFKLPLNSSAVNLEYTEGKKGVVSPCNNSYNHFTESLRFLHGAQTWNVGSCPVVTILIFPVKFTKIEPGYHPTESGFTCSLGFNNWILCREHQYQACSSLCIQLSSSFPVTLINQQPPR